MSSLISRIRVTSRAVGSRSTGTLLFILPRSMRTVWALAPVSMPKGVAIIKAVPTGTTVNGGPSGQTATSIRVERSEARHRISRIGTRARLPASWFAVTLRGSIPEDTQHEVCVAAVKEA